jgi:lipocalin
MKFNLTFCIAAIILLLLNVIICDFRLGKCPSLKFNVNSFDLQKCLGKWYEIVRSKIPPLVKGKCSTTDFRMNKDGTFSIIDSELENGSFKKYSSLAIQNSLNPLELDFFSPNSTAIDSKYYVLDVDCDNYALIYSCTNGIKNRNKEYVWLLFRSSKPNQQKLDQLLNYIQSNLNISKNNLFFVDQNPTTCKYFSAEFP